MGITRESIMVKKSKDLNRDFYTGVFFGGILALIIEAVLMMFDLVGISALIWIIIVDFWMAFDLLFKTGRFL